MKKILLITLFLFSITSLSFAASYRLDNVTIDPNVDSSVDLDLYLIGSSAPEDIDSAAFTLADIEGLSVAVAMSPPSGWSPIVTPTKFGATDFGWPSNAIESEFLFATLTLSWDFSTDSFFKEELLSDNSFEFYFDNVVLSNSGGVDYTEVTSDGGIISAVPVPGSILLLSGGLFALAGISRRKN